MDYLVATGAWARRHAELASVLEAIGHPGDDRWETTVVSSTGGDHTLVARVPPHGHDGGGPLRFVHDDRCAVLVDGCSTTLQVRPADPQDLTRARRRLLTDDRGQFVAVVLDRDADRLDVVNDVLGLRQAYHLATEDGWLVSNSVRALTRLGRHDALDEVGVSNFLVLEYAGGDRTLARNVSVLPAASHWVWTDGAVAPGCDVHTDLHRLVRESTAATGEGTTGLRAALADACEQASARHDQVRCGLTAGRDSRVLLSLLTERAIDTTFATSGDPRSEEVAIARGLAALKGVRHRVVDNTPEAVLERWDDASAQLVASTDGMVTLWQVADVLTARELGGGPQLTFWGIGGEIARAHHCNPRWYTMRKSRESVSDYLATKLLAGRDELLRPDCVTIARSHIEGFVGDAVDRGIRLDDVPDFYYLVEQVRRKSGSNTRKSPPGTTLYTPFVTRPFIEAAFALSPQMRYAEALHRQLLSVDRPLFEYPFEAEPWRIQVPWLVLAQRAWRKSVRPRLRSSAGPGTPTFDHRRLLEVKLPELRASCLDEPSSRIWDFVDRARYESLTAPGATRSERSVHVVYAIATLHAWEHLHRCDAPPSGPSVVAATPPGRSAPPRPTRGRRTCSP